MAARILNGRHSLGTSILILLVDARAPSSDDTERLNDLVCIACHRVAVEVLYSLAVPFIAVRIPRCACCKRDARTCVLVLLVVARASSSDGTE